MARPGHQSHHQFDGLMAAWPYIKEHSPSLTGPHDLLEGTWTSLRRVPASRRLHEIVVARRLFERRPVLYTLLNV
jgi:hypothetical protein